MVSQTEICNIALGELGTDLISDLDGAEENAITCRARFATIRDITIRSHRWNVAKRRAQIPALATVPLFGWAYAYTQPPSPFCLRVLEINEDPEERFAIEARQILCNVPGPLSIRFLARLDGEITDPLLADAIAARLATAIAHKVTGQASRVKDMRDWYDRVIAEARSIDSIEGEEIDVKPVSEWLAARA